MKYITVILIAMAVSWLTTKIITIKYFKVIDGYVKGFIDEALRVIVEMVGNKK